MLREGELQAFASVRRSRHVSGHRLTLVRIDSPTLMYDE